MGTRLVIDGNSVYEIDETCQRGGREFWSGSRKGSKKLCSRGEENGSCQPGGKRRKSSSGGFGV